MNLTPERSRSYKPSQPIKQNGAIASLILPKSSTSSGGPSPSTSFSPPASPVNRSNGRITPSKTYFNTPHHHYHLPSYRFVDEDPRFVLKFREPENE
jgi:transglutaminase-like putative cysteine protease